MVRNYLKFIGFFTLLSSKCFGAEEKGMPQLNPEYWISQIFWVMLIFGALYIILWKIILPKITENLENRKSKILTDLDDAQKFKDQSEKKLLNYNEILNQVKQEAKKIIGEAKKKINNDIENKTKQFNLEIEKEIEKAENEIKTVKLSSIKNVNKIAIEISSEIVRKILNIEANVSSVSAIVEDVSKKKLQNIYDN